jgi:valyl-tRNA synthetase
VEYNFKFVNKIWNITKLVNMNLDGDLEPGLPAYAELDMPARWILSRLNRLIATIQHLFDIFQYGEAGNQILAFMWDEFAPWYLEISKQALYNGTDEQKQMTRRVMVHTLDTCLRLLHPFMPFMTEEAWSYIPHDGPCLIMASWPQSRPEFISQDAEDEMQTFMELVRDIRNIRTEYKVDPAKRIGAQALPGARRDLLARYSYIFARLCNVQQLDLLEDNAQPLAQAASAVYGDTTIFLPLEGLIDLQAERARLSKEHANLSDQAEKLEAKLSNEGFVSKAPPAVVERERERLSDMRASLLQIQERLATLGE